MYPTYGNIESGQGGVLDPLLQPGLQGMGLDLDRAAEPFRVDPPVDDAGTATAHTQPCQRGVMQEAKWVENRDINDHNLATAGREVYNVLCSSCHSVGGPLHDIKQLTAKSSPAEMDLIISTMGTMRPYMPPFIGTEQEKKALYHFLFTTLHGVPVTASSH